MQQLGGSLRDTERFGVAEKRRACHYGKKPGELCSPLIGNHNNHNTTHDTIDVRRTLSVRPSVTGKASANAIRKTGSADEEYHWATPLTRRADNDLAMHDYLLQSETLGECRGSCCIATGN